MFVPRTLWISPLAFGASFSEAMIAAGWNCSTRRFACAWASRSSFEYSMTIAAPVRAPAISGLTTDIPAATTGALKARRLWDSVTKIGRAPRPMTSARPSAATPTGPSVSPAGIHGGTPAPVARIT